MSNEFPAPAPGPTIPSTLTQKTVFGAITECTKDATIEELQKYFLVGDTGVRFAELLRLDKYSVALDVTTDPLATAVSLIREYPDVIENLPLIAVMSTTGTNNKMAVSEKFVSLVIPSATVVGGIGPFDLSVNNTLSISTLPSGDQLTSVASTFTFPSFLFATPTAVTVDELITVINQQALYCTAIKYNLNGVESLALQAGGSQGIHYPNNIVITGGTAMSTLGFTLLQNNKNFGAGAVAYNRYCVSANLTIGLEVVAESDNIRTELSDLLFDFFTFAMADRQFQFYGRSMFDYGISNEFYQIVIKDNEISLSGEQETPRPNDPRFKIYVNRLNIPVTVIQYTDRQLTTRAGVTIVPQNPTGLFSIDLPTPN
jgi:hypothetical protein